MIDQNGLLVACCLDRRGVDLISDALPFGRLWYTRPDHAVIQTHEQKGDFKEP